MIIAAVVFAILSAACFLAQFLFKYYAANVAVLGVLQVPIMWVSIAFAAVAGALILTLIIKGLKK